MKRLLPLALTVPLVLAACGGGNGSTSSDTTTEQPEEFTVDEIEAQLQCEDLVKNSLKSPSTADFPWKNDWTFTPVDGGYQASSYVDSENSFGAELRSNFQCTVTKAEGTDDKVMRQLDYLNQQ